MHEALQAVAPQDLLGTGHHLLPQSGEFFSLLGPSGCGKTSDTAVAVAATALAEDLSLVELNPVVAHRRGVTVVDAVIRLSQSALAPPGRRRAGAASARN
jgi:ABC-type nitrate/sulfonate/bicarbonate transport system ATPase subunit